MKFSDPASLYPVLIHWFDEHARDLPWRHTDDPWAILVCEVMSQQTPVSRVLPAWNAWMKRWPTPADLARANTADVLIAWDRLGYPRRALRLQECAQAIEDRFGGHVPEGRDDLLSLPGIGPYTADAIIAFAYNERSIVLDTNIRRVLARWHGDELPAPSQTTSEIARAERFVPTQPQRAARWNMAIMEFGALVCTARSPKCEACPFTDICTWYLAGKPENVDIHRRRTQRWEGTNRQARGAIMGLLRTEKSVERAALDELGVESGRITTALDGLLTDGLLVQSGKRICLPTGTPSSDR